MRDGTRYEASSKYDRLKENSLKLGPDYYSYAFFAFYIFDEEEREIVQSQRKQNQRPYATINGSSVDAERENQEPLNP
jgi:hypothetical protein